MPGSNVLFPLADYPNGTHVITRTIPGQVNSITFSVLRCTSADNTIWPNDTTGLQVDCEVSYDNRVTWEPFGGFAANGGIVQGHSGEAPVSKGTWYFPGPDTIDARLTLTVTGGPLRSEGTASWV